jgi:hypothetical protein
MIQELAKFSEAMYAIKLGEWDNKLPRPGLRYLTTKQRNYPYIGL